MPRLYSDLANWFTLLTAPADYAEEIGAVHDAFLQALGRLPSTLLELGAGGGHLASHLDPRINATLTDISADMLEQSKKLNPKKEHLVGDMRTLRLDRQFEGVLIHDAIMYMTTRDELLAALTTARAHMQDSGACFVMPDHVAETFEASTGHGGEDGDDGRSLRYLEWTHPVPEGATSGDVDFIVVMKHADGRTEVVHDRHHEGVFPREVWIKIFREAGFDNVEILTDAFRRDNFLATVGPARSYRPQ
jgi:SAM-dependent methyltransferase